MNPPPRQAWTLEEAILYDLTLLLAEDFADFKILVQAVREEKRIERYFAGPLKHRFVEYVPGERGYCYTVVPEVAAVVKKYVHGDGLEMRIDAPRPQPEQNAPSPSAEPDAVPDIVAHRHVNG